MKFCHFFEIYWRSQFPNSMITVSAPSPPSTDGYNITYNSAPHGECAAAMKLASDMWAAWCNTPGSQSDGEVND